MISFSQGVYIALNYASNKLACGTLIVKIKKKLICACSILPRVSIYASNEPPCGTLMVRIRKSQFVHVQ